MTDRPRFTGQGRKYRSPHYERAMRDVKARASARGDEARTAAAPTPAQAPQEPRRGWGAIFDAVAGYASQRGPKGMVEDARSAADFAGEVYDAASAYTPHVKAAIRHFQSSDDVSVHEAAQMGAASAASEALHRVVKRTAQPKKRGGFWSRLNPWTNVRDAAAYVAEPAAHAAVHGAMDVVRGQVQEYHRPGSRKARRAAERAAQRPQQIGEPSAPTVDMPAHLRPTPQNFDAPRRGQGTDAGFMPVLGADEIRDSK